MNHLDETKNQHFISQAELRLNAINPQASEENQKIYPFLVEDREKFRVKLTNNSGIKINRTLSEHDLFSFDIPDEGPYRHNFEKIFGSYEGRVKIDSTNLIEKITNGGDISSEVLNLFTMKFLNFVRNPYSIRKVLNTFPVLRNLRPNVEHVKKTYEKLIEGRRPQQKYVCKWLGVPEEDYEHWLCMLLMLLSEFDAQEPNFMEKTIKDLYESPDNVVSVMVYTYSDNYCVVSDRGFTVPLKDHKHMSFDFNLNSNSFIRYIFGDLEELLPQNLPRNVIENYKKQRKKVKAYHFNDDLETLKIYNQRAVYQCFERVYSSSKENYGL